LCLAVLPVSSVAKEFVGKMSAECRRRNRVGGGEVRQVLRRLPKQCWTRLKGGQGDQVSPNHPGDGTRRVDSWAHSCYLLFRSTYETPVIVCLGPTSSLSSRAECWQRGVNMSRRPLFHSVVLSLLFVLTSVASVFHFRFASNIQAADANFTQQWMSSDIGLHTLRLATQLLCFATRLSGGGA